MSIIDSWLHRTPDGRTWRMDYYGPGQLMATDIMSPTGYHEWVTPDQVRFPWIRDLNSSQR